MLDAVVLSDLHLGSDNCQARSLTTILEQIHHGSLSAHKLILNGDLFDSIDFRRLKKHHWKVLSLLRKLSDRMEVLWLVGNHDGSSEIVSHLLGVQVLDEVIIESGRKRILFLHGHIFDEFIDNHPFLTRIADRIYGFLQKIDSSHSFARFAKKRSKIFLRCAEKIETQSREYARKLGCDAVCCGHTHLATVSENDPVAYYNSGCWTEKPCTWLTVLDGKITLHSFSEEMEGSAETTEESVITFRPVVATNHI